MYMGSIEPGDKTGLRLSPHLAPSTWTSTSTGMYIRARNDGVAGKSPALFRAPRADASRYIRAPLLRPSLGLEEGWQLAIARVLPPRQGRGARGQ